MDVDKEDSAALAPDGADEFDAALAEAEANRNAPAAAASDGGDEPATPADDPTAQQAGDPGQAAGDPAPAGAPTEDVWKDAPPALRAQFEELQRSQAAMAGRVSVADRRANLLEQQLRAANAGSGTTTKGDDAQSISTALENDPDVKQLQEEYPEVAGPMLKVLSKIAARQEQMAAPVQQIEQMRAQADTQARYAALTERHPDWQQYANDARWGEFLAAQPQFVRDMHARNLDVSDPDEAADVLTRFKGFIGATATPSPPSAPTADPKKRQRQLDAARDGGSSGGGAATSGVPDDFDAAASIYAARRDRELQGSRTR